MATHYQKNMRVFSAQQAHWIAADFRKKSLFREIKNKHLSSYVFLLVFFVAHINFSSQSSNFPKKCPMLFFRGVGVGVDLINFSRNR